MDKRQLLKNLTFMERYGSQPRGSGKNTLQANAMRMLYGGNPDSIIIAYRDSTGALVNHAIYKDKVVLEDKNYSHDILITEKEFNKYRAQGAIICDYHRSFGHYFQAHKNKTLWKMEKLMSKQYPFKKVEGNTFIDADLINEAAIRPKPTSDMADAMSYAFLESVVHGRSGIKVMPNEKVAMIDLGL